MHAVVMNGSSAVSTYIITCIYVHVYEENIMAISNNLVSHVLSYLSREIYSEEYS